MRVAVIGGGAAGFFAAIGVKENYPEAYVSIFEKTNKLLSKVKVSGGGRCNVTNGTKSIKELCDAYPRGSKQLKKLFKTFRNKHTIEWFESRGVALKTESDNRVFPKSNSSQTIIDCFLEECRKHGINILMKQNIIALNIKEDEIELISNDETTNLFDKVIIASGGHPKRRTYDWLEDLGHQIVEPVPSLFTFNMPNESIKSLKGVVAENTITSIESLKYKSGGPLLITHWGMSGPSILRLSSFGARDLFLKNYKFTLKVNWIGISNEEMVFAELKNIANENPKKYIQNIKPFKLPDRLWQYLIERSNLNHSKPWGDLGKKGIFKIVRILCNDKYEVIGKTTFKEEFVTCGGVSLESVHMDSMRSKTSKNLYFTGEILDIDGITGGFNFQSAWTTAHIASQLN